jgi:hypothetical protein
LPKRSAAEWVRAFLDSRDGRRVADRAISGTGPTDGATIEAGLTAAGIAAVRARPSLSRRPLRRHPARALHLGQDAGRDLGHAPDAIAAGCQPHQRLRDRGDDRDQAKQESHHAVLRCGQAAHGASTGRAASMRLMARPFKEAGSGITGRPAGRATTGAPRQARANRLVLTFRKISINRFMRYF